MSGTGGYGRNPWGAVWGQQSDIVPVENIPRSTLWTAFDLSGVRQPDDMTRVQYFVETATLGSAGAFFAGSFNIASGGAFPHSPAILDINVAVTETYTVEWRVKFHALAPSWADVINEHLLLGVNDAGGPCTTLLVSQDGIAYTGAFHYDGSNEIVFDHLLNPGGTTEAERHLQILPGSQQWITTGVEYYVRLIADWEAQLVYLYVTDAATIIPGVPGGADSTGHILRALLPIIPYSTATYPPIDRIAVHARGNTDASWAEFFSYQFSYSALIPNLPPRAITSSDQAVRMCSIIQLDGSASFDPEGAPLTYLWRLIDGPDNSRFVAALHDGVTHPDPIPSGFTATLYSDELGAQDELEPILPGDVISIGGVSYSIVSKKPEIAPPPFYVVVERAQIPDSYTGTSFKLLRQAGISGRDTVKPTFYPDQPGFYLFDLEVNDGVQWSTPDGLQRATTVINVLESPLPRGCTPNLSFIFDYLSDFWKLVEDSDIFSTFWSALAQVAASELLTLWQHEYSKSIRDIQRTFIRRWLHYDLLVGEPIPELSKTFVVYGGIASTQFTALKVHNRSITLRSPALEADVTVTFSALEPVDAVNFTAGLGRYLQTLHPSFSATLVPTRLGTYIIRLDAPFYFEVIESTTALFTVGSTNRRPAGTGAKTAERSYKINQSLLGLSVTEAFLVLGDTAYVIDRAVDDPSDEFPYQRVVLREVLEEVSSDWMITGWVSSELLDFYNGLVSRGDVVDLEVVQESVDYAPTAQFFEVVQTVAYGASVTFPSRLPADFDAVAHFMTVPDVAVRLARIIRCTHLPVDSLVVDVPLLQEHVVISDDSATLRRNLDYFIEPYRGRNSIRFVTSPHDVWEGQRPPERLWAEYTYLDNNPTIEANFGLAVEFTSDDLAQLPNNVDYLSAVSGLLYAFTNGPTVRNLRIGTQILLGLPYAEEDGVISEVRKDLLSNQGRILITDNSESGIVRSYTFPKVLELETNPATQQQYQVGDSVTRFAPLVRGAEVIDYVKDPKWFEGIVNQGIFWEIQKFHTFLVRVDSKAFSLNSLLFVKKFINKIKPTYTYPRFVVSYQAGALGGDEISVNDERHYRGVLSLDTAICAGRNGASTIFDQPWPGGGQPWAGDPAGHGHSWRNAFDTADNRLVDPVFPTPQPVGWAYDKEYLCPHDVVTSRMFLTQGAPGVPAFGAYVGTGVTIYAAFRQLTAGPFSIPAGTAGVVVLAATMPANGALPRLSLQLLGPTAPGVAAYTVVVAINGVDAHTYSVTAGVNTELALASALTASAGDTVQVRVYATSLGATAPGWTRIITEMMTDITYAHGASVPAGTYCAERALTT